MTLYENDSLAECRTFFPKYTKHTFHLFVQPRLPGLFLCHSSCLKLSCCLLHGSHLNALCDFSSVSHTQHNGFLPLALQAPHLTLPLNATLSQ